MSNCVVDVAYNTLQEYTTSELDNLAITLNPFTYRSYIYDSETHLYYLNTRYYDPEIGRFVNADSLGYLQSNQFNGLNLYAYCGNNPTINIDPDGTIFVSLLLGSIFLGAILGGVAKGVKAYKQGANAKGIVGAALGGAIMGATMGAAMALGGAAGLGLIGAETALVISMGTGFVAGIASYSVETLMRSDRQWSWENFVVSGISAGFQAGGTTIFSYYAGKAGLFSKDILNVQPRDFLKLVTTFSGETTLPQAIVYLFQAMFTIGGAKLLLASLPSFLIRKVIEKILGEDS